MNSYRDIIDSPIITEKSSNLAQNENTITFSVDVKAGQKLEPNGTYVFKVNVKANKTQIKQAIEKIFNVKVAKITTTLSHPKKKRVGRYTGMTKLYKKAYVTLKEGSTISFD